MPKTPKPDRKQLALRQEGTLNPHPEQVTDELFRTHQFFDARDLVQVKYEMLRRVESDAQPISRAAAAFGFSRPSFYQAQATFQEGGLPALMPHKRGPKQAHKLTNEVLAFVHQLRQQNAAWRPADLSARIQERYGITVHPRSIERALVRSQKNRGESLFAQRHGPSGSCHPLRAAAPPCANGHNQQHQRGSRCVVTSRISSLDPSLFVQHSIASEGSRPAASYRRSFACRCALSSRHHSGGHPSILPTGGHFMTTDVQKVTAAHLKRNAYLYIRQSTPRQVLENVESTKRQYALQQRAIALGWPAERIVVIDSDLGHSS